MFRAIEGDRVRRRLIYDVPHKRMRGRLDPAVRTGTVECVLCGELIPVGAAWDLAHSEDRRSWLGPSHAVCNRREAGFKTARIRWEQWERRTSESW